MAEVLDLTADLAHLRALTTLAGQPTSVDEMLERALDALAELVPYDLAAVLMLRGTLLKVRMARGRLADERVESHQIDLEQFPRVRRALETRRALAFLEEHHAGTEGDVYDGVLDLPDGHACMVVPLFAGERTLGAITLDRDRCEPYPQALVEIAGIYGQVVSLALVAAEQAMLLDRYRARLEDENRLLRDEVGVPGEAGARLLRSRSAALHEVAHLARQVAATDAPVLIGGETGVGKELLAQAIHEWSPRAQQPFVRLNCAALPENLVESELFGHVKGAFSGATSNRPGRFVTANGGTLLLDEIGDLPLGTQGKLLRVLQESTFEAVGSDRTVKVDVRIVAATHVELERAVREGRFRADLFYRLSVFPLYVPPLRARVSDVLQIAEDFLEQQARRTGRGPWHLTPEAEKRLLGHDWPGNVRELVNVLERATILQSAGALDLAFLRAVQPTGEGEGSPDANGFTTLEAYERKYIERVLRHTAGRVYGSEGAAEILGLKPSTLQSRMLKLGVQRP